MARAAACACMLLWPSCAAADAHADIWTLRQLGELRNSGVVTEAEFGDTKAAILRRLGAPQPAAAASMEVGCFAGDDRILTVVLSVPSGTVDLSGVCPDVKSDAKLPSAITHGASGRTTDVGANTTKVSSSE
eukprot:gene18990-31853_t